MDRARAIILGCASPLADAPGYNIIIAPVWFLDGKSLMVYLHYLTLDNDHPAREHTKVRSAHNFAIH